MTDHTPGPWWRDDDGFVAAGSGDAYVTVADFDCSDDISADEREANKVLAIAAPALLEALRYVVGEADGQHADPAAVLTRIAAQARAVLDGSQGAPAMVPQQVQQAQARDVRHAKGILAPGPIPDRKRRPAEPAETFAMGRFGTVVPADPSKPLSEDLVMLGRLIGTDHPRGRAEARGIVERALGDVATMLAAIVRPSAELQALRLGWQFDVQSDEAGEWAWFREDPEHDDDRAVLHGTGWRVYVESAHEAVAEGLA